MSTAIKRQPDSSTDQQLPNSRRIYIDGTQPGCVSLFARSIRTLRVTSRTSWKRIPPCAYTRPLVLTAIRVRTDVREGLAQLRREWIIGRGDVEEYEGRSIQPIDDGYLTFESAQTARDKGRLEDFPTLRRTPLRARKGSCVTQMHYARRGSSRPKWNSSPSAKTSAANLECADLSALSKAATSRRTPNDDRSSLSHQHLGQSFGAAHPRVRSPPNLSATKSPAAAPSFPPTSITPNPSR